MVSYALDILVYMVCSQKGMGMFLVPEHQNRNFRKAPNLLTNAPQDFIDTMSAMESTSNIDPFLEGGAS